MLIFENPTFFEKLKILKNRRQRINSSYCTDSRQNSSKTIIKTFILLTIFHLNTSIWKSVLFARDQESWFRTKNFLYEKFSLRRSKKFFLRYSKYSNSLYWNVVTYLIFKVPSSPFGWSDFTDASSFAKKPGKKIGSIRKRCWRRHGELNFHKYEFIINMNS